MQMSITGRKKPLCTMLDRWPRSEEMRVGCPLSRSYARYATLCESGRQRTDRRPRSVLRIRDKVDRAENARGEVKSKLLRTNAGDSTRERAERRDERLDRLEGWTLFCLESTSIQTREHHVDIYAFLSSTKWDRLHWEAALSISQMPPCVQPKGQGWYASAGVMSAAFGV